MNTFKKHDVVRHIATGHIGKVLGTNKSDWDYCNDVFHEREQKFVTVRFFDIKKGKEGLYHAEGFELYSFDTKDSNTLSDWMATPKEKLRNILSNKKNKQLRNRITQNNIRIDGRR